MPMRNTLKKKAMMPKEKRVPQLDKVMVDATNVRGSLLKHGWFVVPVEKRDTSEANLLPFNQRKGENKSGIGMNGNYKDDLLNTKASKKEPMKSGKCREKTSKIPSRHEADINFLLQQGWSVAKKSRHQITVVKVPESITKSLCKSASLKMEEQVEAPTSGVFHKKTLFRRLFRRSRKLMGSIFKCGRKE
ncbi:hypothetical protein LOTGIDRAFT_162936 [Lottia gigantea]|uniref:Uncharacterized protein n=1 Tax=Lottia gigantea TaxID=225164 RepID=V4AA48_LOTGI|nr:hypothetical protein LOTGIDRAFT_162936 [Lottia gigantea]XP_009058404.1 hypothetical protein LOTGIDRAFT_175796 [Lottia gigantea]ESO90908.1 hypothetical protein LOTGIDRAFT_175796 [Lottia gigantea]ESO91935.1 hypothetical protein LOTGIDRAFT_162936 [Lottia gigantea]